MPPPPTYVTPHSAFVSGAFSNIRQKIHQKFPKLFSVSPSSHPLLSPCWPFSNLWLQTQCLSPLITFSEEFLECVVTVGRICSLLRVLSGISAVWLLEQFLNVHLLFWYSKKTHHQQQKDPVRFPKILTMHSSIWVVPFFWTFVIWTGRILFST